MAGLARLSISLPAANMSKGLMSFGGLAKSLALSCEPCHLSSGCLLLLVWSPNPLRELR